MDDHDYQDNLNAIRSQLNEGKTMTLEGLRKTDPDIQKINTTHSQRLTQLGANYFSAKNMRRGQLANEEYQVQVEALNATRDKAENDIIRPGFIKAREQMLADSFGDNLERLDQAKKDLEKDTSLKWLRDPENEKAKEREFQNNKGEGREENTKKSQKSNQPDITARFDDVAEKDYQETHNKFNRSAKTNVPEQMKGYPESSPPEGRKAKGDLDLTKEYNAGEKFPGFDDFSPGESSVEPTMNGPDVDIGDRE